MNLDEMLEITSADQSRPRYWTPDCPSMPRIWDDRLTLRQRFHVLRCINCRSVRAVGRRRLLQTPGGCDAVVRVRRRKLMLSATIASLFVIAPITSVMITEQRNSELRTAMAAAHQAAIEQRAHELRSLNQSLSQYQQELDAIPGQVASLDSRVQTYMSQHPQAVIALCAGIGGSSVALDANNEYSQEAKAVGGIAAFLAVMWASQNMDEVNEVLKEINRASEEKRSLTARTEALNISISEVKSKISELGGRPIVP